MSHFVAVVDLAGRPVGAASLTAALETLARVEGRLQYLLHESLGAAWVAQEGTGRPCVAERDGIVAVGSARLSNRVELCTSLGGRPPASDLETVAAVFAHHGARGIPRLVGDFAFVLYDTRRGAVFAARDALGVKPLFVQRRHDCIAIGSHLDCFEQGHFDRDYLAELIGGRSVPERRTAFAGIERVPPGTWLVAEGSKSASDRFWSGASFRAAERVDVGEAVERFRGLFEEAVAAQLDEDPGLAPTGPGPVWAELSGGLDSSSVVVMAEHLARQGIGNGVAGTVTVVDTLGDGDETRFSDLVLAGTGIPNEQVRDPWPWQRDGVGPSFEGGPRHFLPFFARDREVGRRVLAGGGRVLLSGYGSDQYLSGRFDFVADLLARRRWREAAGTVLDLAVATRQSFWRLGWEHGISHLLGRHAEPPLPAWLSPEVAAAVRRPAPEPGRIFDAQTAFEVESLDIFLDRGPLERGLEIRYPFLHRPLVEFALSLPIALRARPNRQKWILREAMGSLLPAEIRNRTGKGGIGSRVLWALEQERPLLDALVRDSHLAELGLVDRDALARELEVARAGGSRNVIGLLTTLAVETWLAGRSGWWAQRGIQTPAAGVSSAANTHDKELRDVQQAVVH
ncbi:MAG: asparagine synthase-related protein [Gemmatimonadales bacterium]